jgi:hypothetical protein
MSAACSPAEFVIGVFMIILAFIVAAPMVAQCAKVCWNIWQEKRER